MKQKNIVLIMADQQRGDALEIAGNTDLSTPNLNQLARSGIRFTNAFSECPICIPARHTMLTGMSPDKTGCVGWEPKQRIANKKETLPSLLKQHGYQTVAVGRDIHQYPKHCRYGFDVMLGYEEEAMNYYSSYRRHLLEENVGSKNMKSHGISMNGVTVKPWQFDEKHHTTNLSVNKAIEFLDTRDREDPYFMYVGFVAPHPPLVPPAYYLEQYLNKQLKKPYIGTWEKDFQEENWCLKMNGGVQDASSEAMEKVRAAYYALIQHIDDQLYLLLERLRQEDEEVYIIYTSDHGEMLGDHNRFRKSQPYQGAVHIPFLISGPDIPAKQVANEVVGLQDILPTVCEIAGIEVPEAVTGKSVLKLFRKEEARKFIHGEHAPMSECDGSRNEKMIHTGFHYLTDGIDKYIWFVDGTEQFFHMQDDYGEQYNLIQEEVYQEQIQIWQTRMIETLKDRPEGFSDGRQLIAGCEYHHAMPHAVVD